MEGNPTTYERLLRDAYELGRGDGAAAAGPELHPEVQDGQVSRGLDPDALAARLWDIRPGRPPAGLPLNGPRWYAAGFRAGLSERATAAAVPSPRRAAPLEVASPVD